jgi:hypothetical protein
VFTSRDADHERRAAVAGDVGAFRRRELGEGWREIVEPACGHRVLPDAWRKGGQRTNARALLAGGNCRTKECQVVDASFARANQSGGVVITFAKES